MLAANIDHSMEDCRRRHVILSNMINNKHRRIALQDQETIFIPPTRVFNNHGRYIFNLGHMKGLSYPFSQQHQDMQALVHKPGKGCIEIPDKIKNKITKVFILKIKCKQQPLAANTDTAINATRPGRRNFTKFDKVTDITVLSPTVPLQAKHCKILASIYPKLTNVELLGLLGHRLAMAHSWVTLAKLNL